MSQRKLYQFPVTHWSEVERAGQGGAAGADALGRLLHRYLHPLRAHLILEKRLDEQRAEDLLQGFIADKVLHRNLLGAAVSEKGRFRTFLLVALDRYVSNQLRNERRQRRGADRQVSLQDAADHADDALSPSGVFEVAWARQVLGLTADRMRAECDASGRHDIWRVFEGRLLLPTLDGSDPLPYEQLVADYGIPSLDAASNLLVTAKRMFARNLRGVVGEYMGEDGQIEQEIADLRAILARGRD